jgi:16S rRNA (guanine(966)-N(2))-methyltransferase RsmD
MRVIAGTLGGRRLTAVPGRKTRPTADRVREALFSRLQSRYRLEGASVLDLFAGTGALGIEALSRGAGRLVSVEIDRRAARVLIANLQACALEGRSEVHVRDAAAVIEALGRRSARFEGAFIDPPYGMGLAVDALERLARAALISEGGWVVLETSSDEELPGRFGRLTLVREDLYGDTKLALYELSEEEETVDD